MTIELPEPSADVDVWGEKLNAAIEQIEQLAEDAANAAATNVQVTAKDGSSITIGYGLESAKLVLSAIVGAKSGIATLDSGGNIPVGQFGNISPAGIGAAPAIHNHNLSDVPQAAQQINQAPAVAVFNTTTSKWPLLSAVTDSPTRPIIWMGDADIPTYARPGVDFFYGPRKSGSSVSTPTPPTPPTATPDANGVTQSVPVVTVNGSTFNITATVTTNSNKTFPYLQIAVRGPSGQNYDTGYAYGAVINTTTQTLTGSGTADATGTWTTFLAYNLTGAADAWVNGPSATFSIASLGGVPTTPGNGTPGSGAFPVLGRSGKAWNSGVCDRSNADVPSCQAFFNWRGSQGDAIMFFSSRGSFDEMTYVPDGLTSWPGYRVIAIPSQPNGQSNAATAAGSNNTWWTNYGLMLKNKGWDDGRTIIRLNWEPNGNWYSWAWVNGGAAQFVNAFKNVVNSVRINAPKTKFDLCVNRGNVNGGIDWSTQIVDPLIGWVDILGLDNYDFAPGSLNDSQFNSMAAINPGLNTISAKCRAKGLKMSIDEWGVCTNVNNYGAGGDNPYYISKMQAWMAANSDVFAMDLYFNINADGLYQQLYPVDTKPNSSARYVQEF